MEMDIILYNGRKYYRFPKHKGKSKRRYYEYSQPKRRGYLHRHIWEDVFGLIPDGCEIHHKDENVLNNHPSNLECLTKIEHFELHKIDFYQKRKLPMKCCVMCNKKYQTTGFKQKYCSKCRGR